MKQKRVSYTEYPLFALNLLLKWLNLAKSDNENVSQCQYILNKSSLLRDCRQTSLVILHEYEGINYVPTETIKNLDFLTISGGIEIN